MDEAVEFAAVSGSETVDAALACAAEAGRSAEGDLSSILRHQQRTVDPDRVVVPISEGMSLQPGTARSNELS